MTPFRWQGEELILQCNVQPKASKDEFVGIHDARLKFRITAPPVDGKANKHLCKYLAKQFGVAANSVSVIGGESSRKKSLCIYSPQRLPTEWGIDWRV